MELSKVDQSWLHSLLIFISNVTRKELVIKRTVILVQLIVLKL